MTTVNNTTSTTSNSTSSSTAYSYLQYKNKISGLVSGMDVDSIMEKLMKAESAQMEKLQQQKQKYEWQRDAYRDVNLKLDTFQKGIFDDYGLKSDWNMKIVSNNSTAITATATSSASGTLNVTEAELATAGQKTATNSTITSSSLLSSLGGVTDGNFTIEAINDAGNYEKRTISYKATDTVKDLMSKISSSGVGITAIASQSSTDVTLSLTANSAGTGAAGAMNILDDSQGIFRKLGLLTTTATGNPNVDNIGSLTSNGGIEGKNGYIKVNGVRIDGTSNSYTVAGYQLNVNESFTTEGTSGLPVGSTAKISSTTNTDDIVKKVKEFVDTYNGLIKDLNQRVTEKKKTDYQPLTDAQKAGMTTDEITKWETAAKAGLLKGDNTLNTVLSNMRQTIATYGGSTNGTGNNSDMLYKIGVSTTKTWSDGGKLEVDEDKLRQALQDDPNIVSRIFTGDSATGAKGIVSTLRTTVQTAVSTIKETAGSDASTADNTYSLGKTISTLGTKISDWKDRLKGIEERYWKQFSAMETAMQKANSQTSIFSSSSN